MSFIGWFNKGSSKSKPTIFILLFRVILLSRLSRVGFLAPGGSQPATQPTGSQAGSVTQALTSSSGPHPTWLSASCPSSF